MFSLEPKADPEIFKAFKAYEAQQLLRNTRIGCLLTMLLMPAGIPMDFYAYHEQFWLFLALRLASACLATIILAVLFTDFGIRCSKFFAMIIPMVPVFFIAWMIAVSQGFLSPYYAGLNLVLLAVGAVLCWTFVESIVATTMVLFIYIGVGLWNGTHVHAGVLWNNFFFIGCMDFIVVVGTYFAYHQRFREFSLRFELDKSRSLLSESNEKLMELDQIKNRFFANISHELRTPLTLLLSPLETMIHGRSQQFDQPTRSLLGIMHANGMRLLKLINDLLDLVRLESGRMEVKREPLEMNAFVNGLTGAALQMAEAKGLKLETCIQPGLGALMIDRDKLEKTVLNLVFNALKFTPKGGSVTLRVERRDVDLVLSVEDTGVGISEKNLPFVFDRFWQADNSSKRKYQGVGIGLSLVKELTEIQGGSVSAASVEGKGTTFTVKLPFMQAEAGVVVPGPKPEAPLPGETVVQVSKPIEAPAQSEEWLANLYRRAELFPATNVIQEAGSRKTVENGSQPTLLVADDEPDMLRFLKSQLTSHYNVLEAVDGQQAVDKATQFVPDIILLDMNMPEKDGLQVCRELRQHPATQNVPIIILTARADEETKLTALSAGANDFLSKPFSTSELHVRVKNLVESHHYREKLAKQKQVLEQTIDQLKETETMLVQTEKMVSLGRMSAGIIHEINNPLNYATTGLYSLWKQSKHVAPEQQAEYKEVLQEVEEGITRVKSIISDLKSFTHPDTEQLDAVEVSVIVGLALRFLSSEWREKVQIDQNLPAHLLIRGNRNKLLQVFVNLFQNSLDAIRRKSYMTEQPKMSIEGREEGNKIIVIVRDNGEGMEQETIAKVFDPFFTTKDVGEGMGLGLTICYRIIREYEGRITARSERGKFCEFRLEFPSPVEYPNTVKPAARENYEPAQL